MTDNDTEEKRLALKVALRLRGTNEEGGTHTFCLGCGEVTTCKWAHNGYDSNSRGKNCFSRLQHRLKGEWPTPNPRFTLTARERKILDVD